MCDLRCPLLALGLLYKFFDVIYDEGSYFFTRSASVEYLVTAEVRCLEEEQGLSITHISRVLQRRERRFVFQHLLRFLPPVMECVSRTEIIQHGR